MSKIMKIKLPLVIISYTSLIYLFYLVYYSSNKKNNNVNTVAIIGTVAAAIYLFLYGLEHIFIKKSKKLGYIACTLAISMPFPIIFLISKVN